MIEIQTPDKEFYDEVTNTFSIVRGNRYKFEHSLISISKWESITCRPFLSSGKSSDKSIEDMHLYFKCMCLDPNFKIEYMSYDNIRELTTYIDEPHTATTIRTTNDKSRKIITSEVIYAMMVDSNVPFECEKWNLNRLLILLNVISSKRNPKKLSKQEIYRQNNELNKLRRAKLNTKG